MIITRQQIIDLLCPEGDTTQEGGRSGESTARYKQLGLIARSVMAHNKIEGASTVELTEAIFPLRWVLDDRSKLTRNRVVKALLRQATRDLKDCCIQIDVKNKWGRRPWRWSAPKEKEVCYACGQTLKGE